MSGSSPTDAVDATSIWDRRYEGGEHVGSKPIIEGDPIDYTQHKFLYRHAVARPQTGNEEDYNLDRVGRLFLTPPPRKMLSIGAGMAFTEEHLLRHDYAQHILAYEMSSAAVEMATKRFAEAGLSDRITMRSADVLAEDLPTGGFDVVFVQAAIHHFDRIEEMFALMHRVLRQGGLLVYDEYIGPDHHIYHDEVIALMDEIDGCLAPGYRWDVLAKHLRQGVPKPSLEWMMQHDPSEGVHATQILPLTYEWFDVIDRRDYGGTVMRPFFTGILPNFDFSDPKDQTVARLIVLIEQLMTRNGIIPHYHTSIVGRRRDAKRAKLTVEESARIAFDGWQGLQAGASVAATPARAGMRGMLRAILGRL